MEYLDFEGMAQAKGWFSWEKIPNGKYRVVPCGDHALIWPSAICVVDDFGNLVRVPA